MKAPSPSYREAQGPVAWVPMGWPKTVSALGQPQEPAGLTGPAQAVRLSGPAQAAACSGSAESLPSWPEGVGVAEVKKRSSIGRTQPRPLR